MRQILLALFAFAVFGVADMGIKAQCVSLTGASAARRHAVRIHDRARARLAAQHVELMAKNQDCASRLTLHRNCR